MGELLSAASLLLTIVTVLYALWYPEIVEGLNIKIPKHEEDWPGPSKKIETLIRSKVIPLFVSSMLVSIVFIPDAISIIKEAYWVWMHAENPASKYSSVKTAFTLVVLFSVYLWLQVSSILIKLISKKRKMNNNS